MKDYIWKGETGFNADMKRNVIKGQIIKLNSLEVIDKLNRSGLIDRAETKRDIKENK